MMQTEAGATRVAEAAAGDVARAPTTAPRIVWWEWCAVALIMALAAWLRWRQIGEQGVWLDEAFSIWMARQPYRDLFYWITRLDQHPPLYYSLLRPWLAVGESEGTIRSLSALLGTLTIPPLWASGRRLFGPAAAIGAALLLAASPFHVRFGQEMRMYTLLTLNASVAILALVYLLTGERRRRWWLLYALFTALTMLSHNTAILFWVAVNVGVAGVWLVQRLRRRALEALQLPPLRSWLLGQFGVLLFWSPWLPSFVRQARMVDNEFWIQPPTHGVIVGTLRTFFSDWLPNDVTWVWPVVAVALLLGIVGAWRRAGAATLLLLLVATPFALELLVSLRRPIFYDRTLIWTTLPLFLLLGAGLGLLPLRVRWASTRGWTQRGAGIVGGAAAAAALAGLLYANYASLQNYYDNFRKEEWREAAAWAAERVRPHDLMLFNATWVQIPFDYYFARHDLDVARHGVPVDMFDAGVLEPKMTEAGVPRLMELMDGYNCVWLVYSHNWYTDPNKILPNVLRHEMMARKGQSFSGLEIQLYERRGGDEDCMKRP